MMRFLKVSTLLLASSAFIYSVSAQEVPTAEVLHAFTSPSESAAMKVIADAFEAAGGKWINTSVAGMPNADALLINRVVAGDAPAATRLIPGARLFALADQDLLNTVDDVAAEEKWSEHLPASVMAAVQRDGHVYGVPFDLSTQNFVFYNIKVLADAGINEPPQTFDAFIADMDILKAKGVIPLALGGQPVWYFNLFNSMLATSAGGKAFEAIYRDRDKEVLKSPEVVLAAERLGKLRAYVDAGSPGRNWNDATALVINGQAAFHLNGDWAKGEFITAGKKPGTDYGCYIGFDGAPLIYGGNAFGFLKSTNPLTVAGQKLLAKVAMDPVVQVNFAKFKGSMPVRTDADISSLDMCAQTAHAYMSDPSKSVIQSESLVTAQEVGELRDLMADYFSDPSMTAQDMLAAFADII